LSYLNTYFVLLPSSQKFLGIVVVIVNFCQFYNIRFSVLCERSFPRNTHFFLAAQMRMRYQAVDHDGVTMLGRSDTADSVSVVFKL
jgi:hypothetical protein